MILIYIFAIFLNQKHTKIQMHKSTLSYVLYFIEEAEKLKAYKQKWSEILIKKILMPD